MAKVTLQTVTTGFASAAQINSNFQAIAAALETLLSRDGTSPNTIETDLDANNNRLYNLPYPSTGSEPVTLQFFEDQVEAVELGTALAANVSVADVAGDYVGENAEAVFAEIAVTDSGLRTDVDTVTADLTTFTGTTAPATYIAKTLADANTIIYATSDNTPAALAISASQIPGRKATGNIVSLTAAEVRTILALGSVYQYDVGSVAYNIVQLDGSAKIPALDGSQLTNLPGLATAYEAGSGTAYTGAGTYTWAHGLAVFPKVVQIHAVCVNVSGDNGFVLGDRIIIGYENKDTGSTNRGFTLQVDTTNVKLYSQASLSVYNPSNTLVTIGTTSDWELYCYAYA